MPTRQSHLKRLEAEAIFIMREVVANFERPVMLYSIGKDSSVMLHLALKAFYPAPPPFPLLHVDTTWKFREMIAFRDADGEEIRPRPPRPHQPGRRGAAASIRSTTARRYYTQVMKTEALKQALDAGRLRRRLRRRPPRRGEEPRQGAHLLLPLGQPCLGPEEPAAGTLVALQHAREGRRDRSASSRCPTGPSSTSGNTSSPRRSPIVPLYFAAERPVVEPRRPAGSWSTTSACACSPARRPRCARSASARSAAIR